MTRLDPQPESGTWVLRRPSEEIFPKILISGYVSLADLGWYRWPWHVIQHGFSSTTKGNTLDFRDVATWPLAGVSNLSRLTSSEEIFPKILISGYVSLADLGRYQWPWHAVQHGLNSITKGNTLDFQDVASWPLPGVWNLGTSTSIWRNFSKNPYFRIRFTRWPWMISMTLACHLAQF